MWANLPWVGFPTVDPAITVLVRLADHLVHLVVSQLLANGSHDVAQLGGRDKAVVVAIEHLERFADLLLGISILHLAGHHGQEFYRLSMAGFWGEGADNGGGGHTGEVDGAVVVGVNLVDHVLQLRLGGVLSKRAHDGAKLLGGDLSWDDMLDFRANSSCELD
jgi:hypothetical protein